MSVHQHLYHTYNSHLIGVYTLIVVITAIETQSVLLYIAAQYTKLTAYIHHIINTHICPNYTMADTANVPSWMQKMPSQHSIILFDGICAVCNTFINFVIDRDPQRIYKFASLQSDIGHQLRKLHGIDEQLDSMILIDQRTDSNPAGVAHIRSTAALRIIGSLGSPYTGANALLYIPPVIRDTGYAAFAKIRYSAFGYVDKCRRPTADVKLRFLETTTLADCPDVDLVQ